MTRLIPSAFALFLLASCAAQTDHDETAHLQTIDNTLTSRSAPNLLMPLPTNTVPAIREHDIAVRIATLADDMFEGRGPSSDAGEAAADWIASEMARIGLKPGADGSYFQTVGMVEQSVDEALSGLSFSNNGTGETQALTLGEDAVIWTKHQTEGELSFADSEVVFVGYGVVAPEYGWNDYAGLDVAGKTVVMLVNDPGYAHPEEARFNGKAMTYYGRWTYKFEEAARQGATAAIIVHETAPASYGWDVVSNSWSGAQADLVRTNGGADRIILEGWITDTLARTLFADAGLDFDTLKAAASLPEFSWVDMGEITASGRITQSVSHTESRNIIGVLEGSTAPEEYMLYMGHWDHLGKKTDEGDAIYNGAVDNATGIATILEIAEGMAPQEIRRSVLFVAVTLEESGLLGSAYFAEYPTVPLNQIVAGINIDALAPTGRSKDAIVVGHGASQLEDLLAEVLAAQDRIIRPDPSPEAGYFYRSDHISLAKKGVPMLYADNGMDLRDGGEAAGKAAGEDYVINRYHKPADEYTDDWDMSGITEMATALYELGLGIAQSDDWPSWYEGNEFRAIRDASLATRGQ